MLQSKSSYISPIVSYYCNSWYSHLSWHRVVILKDWKYISCSAHQKSNFTNSEFQFPQFKWPCARNTGRSGSGKNQKSWFFLLGLKYTLRTCFESKKFCRAEIQKYFRSLFGSNEEIQISFWNYLTFSMPLIVEYPLGGIQN